MTDLELRLVDALCYKTSRYSGTNEDRFLNQLGERFYDDPGYELTERQREWLFAILHKYRKQNPELHRAHCKDKGCCLKMANTLIKQQTQLSLF